MYFAFYLSYNSECLNQDEYAIVGICRLITIRDTNNYIECPAFTDFRIESKLTLILRLTESPHRVVFVLMRSG